MRKKAVLLMSLIIFITLVLSGLPDNKSFAKQETSGKKSAEKKAAEKPKDSCITSKCHAKMEKEKYIHGPIAAGECTVCHGKADRHKDKPEKYKFKKVEDLANKCYSCHDKFKPKKVTHTPVEEGECVACHSPHGSPYKFQLIAKGGDLCFTCHDDEILAAKYVHGPAAVGGCIACHEPHTADHEKNLRAKPPELCYMCHTDKAEVINKAEFVHTPVSENCSLCHNPHSAPEQFMLQSQSPKLCLDCHKEKKEQLAKVSVKHGALEIERSCLNCHDAHMSN
ncbi:MAG: hypothetical protein KAJ10_09360, partial [Thermodesulfovibrionia bacterium]|nr:hypothetical protein [Thermodesulfovibrionia bacterium]